MKIEFKGVEKLQRKLTTVAQMNAVKSIVRVNGAEMTQEMVSKAQFGGGYSTGATRQSIPTNSGIRDDGMTAYAGPTTEHAGFVEKGTRFMSAQPFVEPAFNAQKEQFKRDMNKLV